MEGVFLRGLQHTSKYRSRVDSYYLTRSPYPDPLFSWRIRDGSRWWSSRVNGVGASAAWGQPMDRRHPLCYVLAPQKHIPSSSLGACLPCIVF